MPKNFSEYAKTNSWVLYKIYFKWGIYELWRREIFINIFVCIILPTAYYTSTIRGRRRCFWIRKRFRKRKRKRKRITLKEKEENKDKNEDKDEDDEKPFIKKAKKEPSYIQDFIESEEIEAKFDVEQQDVQAEALALDALAEEEGGDLDEVEVTEETEETTKDTLRPRKMRHKAFSFRYIQREIANDTKSLNFLKNKLKKGKLTHVERLNLLDSLDRRAKMLNSWIQILRWVKS